MTEMSIDLAQYEVRQQGKWLSVVHLGPCCRGNVVLGTFLLAVSMENLVNVAWDHERRELRE